MEQIHGSAILGVTSCADAIKRGSSEALRYGECAKHLKQLSGAGKTRFSYAEIWTDEENIFRADAFLAEQAQSIIKPRLAKSGREARSWYKGVATGDFDGYLKVVDTRGELPQIKLRLTAGGKEIDRICHKEDLEAIAGAIDKRVHVLGAVDKVDSQ